jgi:hypothetical protein
MLSRDRLTGMVSKPMPLHDADEITLDSHSNEHEITDEVSYLLLWLNELSSTSPLPTASYFQLL